MSSSYHLEEKPELINTDVRPALDGFLKIWKEQLFVTKPVREIIFDGYHDPVFDNLEKLIEALPFIKPMIPDGSLMDKFAFFYDRNGTDYIDGVWNMYTGSNEH